MMRKDSSGHKSFRRVLIPNRGEIALRIIRTLRELELESVLLYAPDDRFGLALRYADYAWPLKGQTVAETYLNIPAICEAIVASGADAVHPGYGFLSESPEFCQAVTECGAVFIGPSAESMTLMGNKIEARRLMQAQGIPVVPGSPGPVESVAELRQLAKDCAYPLILKAAAGGGGRGMRIVRSDAELEPALRACRHEALSWFGNDAVFCERYIENPRHIEVQILRDHEGHGVHLFERDCSIQRRHQKLFEEAPSAYLNEAQRESMGAIALKAAAASAYTGAGTVEFICAAPDQAWFMEMNARIQVEHTVTEQITGKDLIREQILIAQGHPLAFSQADLSIRGWSMEARINCEDPFAGFMPVPGRAEEVTLAEGPGIRTDTAVYPGYEIPAGYDSMIAKLIVSAESRNEAIRRMKRALAECHFGSLTTTIPFHSALLCHERFISGHFDTHFCQNEESSLKNSLSDIGHFPDSDAMAIAALAVMADHSGEALLTRPDARIGGEREAWKDAALREQTHQSY